MQQISLKTADEILSARELVAEGLFSGKLDPRIANAINVTLAGAQKLKVELPLKYMQIIIQAKKLKIEDIPQLPEGVLAMK